MFRGLRNVIRGQKEKNGQRQKNCATDDHSLTTCRGKIKDENSEDCGENTGGNQVHEVIEDLSLNMDDEGHCRFINGTLGCVLLFDNINNGPGPAFYKDKILPYNDHFIYTG